MARQFSCLDVARVTGLIFSRRSGDECIYTCPGHDDKHPSLTINKRKNAWMFGPCGVGGTGIWSASTVDVFRRSRLHWIRAGRTFGLSISPGTIVLQPDGGDPWTATFLASNRTRKVIAEKTPLDDAQAASEDFAKAYGIPTLFGSDARWRKKLLRKMRTVFSPSISAGKASDLIAKTIAERCGDDQ